MKATQDSKPGCSVHKQNPDSEAKIPRPRRRKSVYDPLLDHYEPGATAPISSLLFQALQKNWCRWSMRSAKHQGNKPAMKRHQIRRSREGAILGARFPY